jgi:hypothetical protein
MIRSCATSELLNIHPELDRLFDEFTSGRFLSGIRDGGRDAVASPSLKNAPKRLKSYSKSGVGRASTDGKTAWVRPTRRDWGAGPRSFERPRG